MSKNEQDIKWHELRPEYVVPVRVGHDVTIKNIPRDLKLDEVKRIEAFLKSLCVTEPQP